MFESLSLQYFLIDKERQIYRMQKLGAGIYGTVYEGFDKLNNCKLALKYITSDKEQTWMKEVNNLQLMDHQNIIKCYGFVPEYNAQGHVIGGYILTQYVKGHNLSTFIQLHSKTGYYGLAQIQLYNLFIQLLSGYHHIHGKNLVHRDIKPENIIVDEHENIKIIDFGQSKQRKLLKTKGEGTPLYSAPETFQDKNPTDFRRDVWSLGLVLFQMIHGYHPFQQWKNSDDEAAFIKYLEDFKLKLKIPSNFSSLWSQILKKMLKKDFKKRAHIHEIIFELQQKASYFKQRQFIKDIKIVGNQSSKISQSRSSSSQSECFTQSTDQFQYKRTKKYLRFFNNKHRFIILLKEHLTKFSYPFISNSHKLIIVFVSFNIYITSVEHLLKRMEQNKIKISQNEVFDSERYDQPYKSLMKQEFFHYRDYYERQLRLTREFLLEKVIPKLTGNSETVSSVSGSFPIKNVRTSTNQVDPIQLVQKYFGVKQIIYNYNKGINFQKSDYIKSFQNLIKSPDYLQSEENIRKYFYQEDMVVYYLILTVAYLDRKLKWSEHSSTINVLPRLWEQFFNIKRNKKEQEQFIKQICELQQLQ